MHVPQKLCVILLDSNGVVTYMNRSLNITLYFLKTPMRLRQRCRY